MIMKKVLLYLLLLVVALGSCQARGGDDADKVHKTTVHEQLSATEVENRVRDIYAAVFKVYNEEDSLRNLDIQMDNGVNEQGGRFIADYCSIEWNTLVRSINENDSIYHQGELGFWDADYWIMGQDWHALSVSDVKVVSLDDDKATVEFNLHNLDNVSLVHLDMVHEGGEWRIDNFMDMKNDVNWKASMKQYLEEEKKR